MQSIINRKTITSLALSASGFLFLLVPTAFAGVTGSAVPDYPVVVSAGQTSLNALITITNNSTGGNDSENIAVSNIVTHTPSCGSSLNSTCLVADQDPGVFVLHNGTGRAGTACAGVNFTASAPDGAGAVTFTAGSAVTLGPATGAIATRQCIIDFPIDVLKVPTKDANAVMAGVQTDQLASAAFTGLSSGLQANATGSNQSTVNKASPTISTQQSAGGNIGTVLNDTATVSGGATPTGSVTFKLFPPADSTCIGTPSYTDTDPSAPYATNPGFVSNAAGVWHWTADYAGDASNNPVSSGCADEPVTIVPQGHIIVDKVTNPSGDSQSFAFTTTGSGFSGFSLTDAAAPNNQEVVPGAYTVSESATAGWVSDGGVCDNGETPASLDVGAGETVTCTFTNTKKVHIIVDKVTVPSGNTQSFTFTTTGTGYNGFNLTDAANPNNQELVAGSYSVAETPVAGWAQTSATCDNQQAPGALVLTAGQTVTCTFTNTLQNGHLIVQKTTVPAGDPTVFNINASGSGTVVGGGAGTVTDALDKNYEVTPGTYSVSETLPSGWTQTSNTCSGVAVAAGETKTCVITNTFAVQYCSPGYWKQKQHFDSYAVYQPTDLFNTVFGSTAFPGKTLVDVLSTGGGGLTAYGRATVGALLNASSMSSGLTTADVIAKFNATYAGAPTSGNTNGYYGSANPEFTAPENCPLN